MYHYQVSGTVMIDGVGMVDISEHVEYNRRLNAELDRDIVADMAICKGAAPNADHACEWIVGPFISDLPQDQLMNLLGKEVAPMLPGIEIER